MLIYKYIIFQFLLSFIVSQGTYLHFDEEGLQSLGELVLKALSEQELDLGLDYTYNFATGFIHISDLKISEINSNPKQLKTKFDQKNNAIEVNIKLDKMLATANIKLKLLGMNMLKEISQIRIKKTRLQFSLVLGQKADKSLKFSLFKGKFQTFKLGRIKILSGSKWYQKLTNQAMGSFINLFIKGFQIFAKKKAANTIDDFGNKVPNYFILPSPLQSIRIDFPLLTQPKIQNNNLQFNFGCGSDKITNFIPKSKKYLSFGISEDCLTNIVNQAWQIQNLIDISVIAQQLSDIMEIDSKTLAKIFPGFFDLNRAMDVNFEIGLDNSLQPQIKLQNGQIQALLHASTNVQLIDIHRIQSLNNAIFIDFEKAFLQEGLYYTQFNMTAQIEANIRKEEKGFVGNLIKLDILETRIEDSEKFDLEEWNFIQSVFLKFGQSYANQVIYQMMINPEKYISAINLDWIDVSIREQELNLVIDYLKTFENA